ncbi:hypothetical protein ABIE50_002021 [Chitinophaga sp. OAE865]
MRIASQQIQDNNAMPLKAGLFMYALFPFDWYNDELNVKSLL